MIQNIYLLLDVSGSMFGEPMVSMLYGVDALLATLRAAAETDIDHTLVTVITFSTHAKVMAKDIPLSDFTMPPGIKAGGCTNFAGMMKVLLQTAKEDAAGGGRRSPMAFFFMDGYPTDDDYEQSIRDFKAHEWSAYASFAVAGGTEKHFLSQVTSSQRVFDLVANPNFQAAFEALPPSLKGATLHA